MTALQVGWAAIHLRDVCKLLNGRAYKQVELLKEGKYRVLRVGNFFSNRNWYFSNLELEPDKYCDSGDLLYAWSASFGPKIWDGGKVIYHYHIWKTRPNEHAVVKRFLYHWFEWDKENIQAEHGTGSTMIHVTKGDMDARPMHLPPLAEQRRIVAKIDSLSTKSKRARDQLDHLSRMVHKYKQSVLAAAFQGDLTREWRAQQAVTESASDLVRKTEEPLQSRGGREATTDVKPGIAGLSVNAPDTEPPPNWAWVRLRRIARQETGHTPSRSHPEYWDGGIPWIGIPDAGNHHGQVIHETLQTVSDQGLENSSARLLPAGTVCLSRTASVGYVTIMGRSMATSQDFATWTCTPALVPKYLMFALMAEGENIRKFGEGSTHTTIYFPEIRALHICLAPLAEQHEIVRRIESALAWIERLASEATSARKLIDHLDQAILAKAFHGELVPQDPSDEPASVLLDRIRAERTASATPTETARSRRRRQ